MYFYFFALSTQTGPKNGAPATTGSTINICWPSRPATTSTSGNNISLLTKSSGFEPLLPFPRSYADGTGTKRRVWKKQNTNVTLRIPRECHVTLKNGKNRQKSKNRPFFARNFFSMGLPIDASYFFGQGDLPRVQPCDPYMCGRCLLGVGLV